MNDADLKTNNAIIDDRVIEQAKIDWRRMQNPTLTKASRQKCAGFFLCLHQLHNHHHGIAVADANSEISK